MNVLFIPIIFAKESEELGIDLIDDFSEIRRVVLEIQVVGLDDQHASLVMVVDKIFVLVVEVLEVIDLHRLLIIPTSFLDLGDQRRHRFTEVDHEVRHLHLRFHEVEEFHEGLKIPWGEVSALVIIADEDIDALEDRAVLYDRMRGLLDSDHVLVALLEEIGLEAESPALDIAVVILEIRIKTDGLKARFPAVIAR